MSGDGLQCTPTFRPNFHKVELIAARSYEIMFIDMWSFFCQLEATYQHVQTTRNLTSWHDLKMLFSLYRSFG